MTIKLKQEQYAWTIEHICKYGDTDIFPYPFELHFLGDKKESVSEELSKLDIGQYKVMSAIESLVPKSRYGFRTAHQIFPVDLVVFSTLVFGISDRIEAGRDPAKNGRVFSYRFAPSDDFRVFAADQRFKDWLSRLFAIACFSDDEYQFAIKTDVSDFYQRIYRHRLENILETLTNDKQKVKLIERIIDAWRGKQSFGIPVGNNATRILAEAALNDVDLALVSEGYEYSRYVDDFMIFVKPDQDAYAALGFLAGQLSFNEGLGLNNQKTRILSWAEFQLETRRVSGEDQEAADEAATEKLFWAAYDDEGHDPDAFEKLLHLNLQKELEEEIDKDHWDMGLIRVLFRALKLTKNLETARYLRQNFSLLIPFAKDAILLIDELSSAGDVTFNDMGEELCTLLLSEKLRPLECTRAWLLELIVRGHVKVDAAQIRRLDSLGGTLDTRQLHLIRSTSGDVNFFRQRKTRVDELPLWTQPSFIYGAKCLPRDEYHHWIRSIKSRLKFPLSNIFVDWCMSQQA